MAVRVEIFETILEADFDTAAAQIAEKDSAEVIKVANLFAPIGGDRSQPSAQRPDRFKQVPIKGSHRRRVTPGGRFSVRWYVENTSGHAAAVHNGTLGSLIVPIRRSTMVLHLGTNGSVGRPRGRKLRPGDRVYRRSPVVRGQVANPWLANAAKFVISKNHPGSTF